jgi:hypothetical protein
MPSTGRAGQTATGDSAVRRARGMSQTDAITVRDVATEDQLGRLEAEVLEWLLDCGDVGVWEIVGWAGPILTGSLASERLAGSELVVNSLLDRGWAELYVTPKAVAGAETESHRVEDPESALRCWRTWAWIVGEDSYWLVATDAAIASEEAARIAASARTAHSPRTES